MKKLIPYILLLAVVGILALFAGQGLKEGFQSGALLQLQTSHVPTPEEIADNQIWLRRRVRDDLKFLNGYLR